MQHRTAGITGLLSRRAARNRDRTRRTAAVSKNEFRKYFDLVGYSEEDYENILKRINSATSLRDAERVMQEVADADPGLFEIRDGTPSSTDNVVIDINAGDTYAPTLVFDEGLGRIELMTWGDAVEAYERSYYEQNFMDGVAAHEVEFEVVLSPEPTPEIATALIRKFESELVQSMGASSDKVTWYGTRCEYNQEYGSLYCEGELVDGSMEMRDFISETGIGHGELSAWDKVDDVMEDTLYEFVAHELENTGFDLDSMPHVRIAGIDRPEQVDRPNYHHL